MRLCRSIGPLVALLCLTASATAQGQRAKKISFTAEESPKQTIPMPDAVWRLMQHDKEIADDLENANLTPEQLPRKWFSVVPVHLHGPAETDYVRQGEPPLIGANVGWFWVVAPVEDKLQVVLFIPAHDLELRPQSYHGYVTIEATAMTSSTIFGARFRFDGKQYVKYYGYGGDIGGPMRDDDTVFDMEDRDRPSISMPDKVWQLMQHDSHVATSIEEHHFVPEELSRAWFSVAPIHLRSAVETDYLVQAQSFLKGEDDTRFWIIAPANGKLQVIFTQSVQKLLLGPKRYRGYVVVEASHRSSWSAVYRFNGRRYVMYRESSADQ